MTTFFACMLLIGAAYSCVNVHRHAFLQIEPSFWSGGSVAVQACIVAGELGLAVLLSVALEVNAPLMMGIAIVSTVMFGIGLSIESRVHYAAAKAPR